MKTSRFQELPDASLNIIDRISERYPHLTASQRRIADYVLADKLGTVARTISELAEQVGVSEPTITRFCSSLGISGYPQFRRLLFMAARITEDTLPRNTPFPSITATVGEPGGFIPGSATKLDSVAFSRAVETIGNAHRILLCGLGESAFMVELIAGMYAERLPNLQSTRFTGITSFRQRIKMYGPGNGLVLVADPSEHRSDNSSVAAMADDVGVSTVCVESLLKLTSNEGHEISPRSGSRDVRERLLNTHFDLGRTVQLLLEAIAERLDRLRSNPAGTQPSFPQYSN